MLNVAACNLQTDIHGGGRSPQRVRRKATPRRRAAPTLAPTCEKPSGTRLCAARVRPRSCSCEVAAEVFTSRRGQAAGLLATVE
jgi:hypothetical protein